MNKRNLNNGNGLTFFNKKFFGMLAGFTMIVLVVMMIARNASTASSGSYTFPNQATTQWSPYSEWSVQNPSYSGNPFDVEAAVSFVHSSTGETRTTHMFYDGNDTWKFRFAGTQLGDWTFTTSSADPELNGLSGLVSVSPNPGDTRDTQSEAPLGPAYPPTPSYSQEAPEKQLPCRSYQAKDG